jgi:hypothetical protein
MTPSLFIVKINIERHIVRSFELEGWHLPPKGRYLPVERQNSKIIGKYVRLCSHDEGLLTRSDLGGIKTRDLIYIGCLLSQ